MRVYFWQFIAVAEKKAALGSCERGRIRERYHDICFSDLVSQPQDRSTSAERQHDVRQVLVGNCIFYSYLLERYLNRDIRPAAETTVNTTYNQPTYVEISTSIICKTDIKIQI